MEDLFEIGELFEDALIPIAIGCVLLVVVCACIACFALVAGGDLLDFGDEGAVPGDAFVVGYENTGAMHWPHEPSGEPRLQEYHRVVEMWQADRGR